jgi:NhaA family Na+:H+ antiporter
MQRIFTRVQDFLRLEAASGLMLMGAAAMALLCANTPLAGLYAAFLDTPVEIQVGALVIAKPLLLWINDGLMAIFFFLVGLEVKREILEGELSSFDKASLPLFAAVGGVVAPALIYAYINQGDAVAMRGWAIPAATDIAFALGVLALFGTRAPAALKIFLLALAIMDDLGAIVIIAVFYAGDLSEPALALAGLGVVGLIALNLRGIKIITPYVLVGIFIWVCVLKSGVHATLAGVVTALAVPIKPGPKRDQSPLHELEHGLHPWVAYMILPLFAFANAGVSFKGLRPDDMMATVPLGAALGLMLGKPLGILAASGLGVAMKIARLPAGISWAQLAGAACLAGIGFTMSLFIGSLAFDAPDALNSERLGVLAGSFGSALLGSILLGMALPRRDLAPAA